MDDETLGAACLPEDLRCAAPGTAQQIADTFVPACGRFTGAGGPVDDDRTVLVIKATARSRRPG